MLFLFRKINEVIKINNEELVKWIISIIKNNNIHSFYISTSWKKKRLEILERDKNECQICKSKGLAEKADTVHHIKYLRRHPELALDDDNLMSVCDSCHWDIHHKVELKKQLNEEKW